MKITSRSAAAGFSQGVQAQIDAALANPPEAPWIDKARRKQYPEEEAGRLLMQWAEVTRFDVPWPTVPGRPRRIAVADVLVHNANGGFRLPIEAAILIGQGVKPSWPDYTLYVARPPYHGAVLELKAEHGAKPTDEQLATLEVLGWLGYFPMIAWGFDEARARVTEYLGL